MGQPAVYATIISALPILLVHLAGVVVAVILLVRRRSTPAILALVGFGVLFVVDIANFGRSPLVGLLARQGGMNWLWIANTGIGCCCSIFDVAAIVCLIVALWQAVSGSSVKESATETPSALETPIALETLEEVPEGIVDTSAEMPEETSRVTRVLEETRAGTTGTSEEAIEENE